MRTLLNYGSDMLGTAAESPTTSDIPGVKPAAALVKAEAPKPTLSGSYRDLLKRGGTGLAGGAAGYFAWEDHRVLGTLTGASVGMNLPGLLKREERPLAAACIMTDAAAVGGALLWKKHPYIGFFLGLIVGGVAADKLIDVEPIKKLLAK